MKKSKFKSSEELHKKGYRYGSIEIKLSKEKSLNMVLYQVDYYGKKYYHLYCYNFDWSSKDPITNETFIELTPIEALDFRHNKKYKCHWDFETENWQEIHFKY